MGAPQRNLEVTIVGAPNAAQTKVELIPWASV